MVVMMMTMTALGEDVRRYDSQCLTTKHAAATVSTGRAIGVVEPLHRSVVHEHTSWRPPKPDLW